MKLSVVILNYNVRYFLELCLKSVQEAITDLDAEIIVVDNNSPDDSCSMVKQLFPRVKLIENAENQGFSKGNNIGVDVAKGEYICILNPDTVVPEDVFKTMLSFCETRKNLGAVGCKLIDGTGHFLPESKRNIPRVKVALKKLLGNSKQYYANHLGENDTGEVDILVGAFMFLKRKVYMEVGGFDEDYFMYGEDIDLSYSLLKSGYQNYYFGEASVLHFKGESTLKDKKYAERFYGAMQIFYKKHFKKNLLFDALVGMGVRVVPLLKGDDSNGGQKPLRYILLSDEKNKGLDAVLPKETEVRSEIGDFERGTELIFDNNKLTFSNMLKIMEVNSNNKGYTFKIWPKNSNFMVGSNSASGRGEVVTF
ncbi:glycosyltransferase family 2 protein [Hyunsoonleella sp. SJ7]|uniref:Glycosyltransferase family 2 protein n=1 Tax=Hyunsoonleella aquatilis TaxID=2762758 RepID=A0A923KL43_9FLAO|nr:glycosyltransferase family 2 protein [Hyunsoonleella aquatilis]MBC3757520.1 glycosyltransferase family 2 protein [Hyunsoonleella aquatilis]